MTNGTVKWFCTEKGYGFIEPENCGNSTDVFVHLTAVERAGYDLLEKGQKVSFTLNVDPRKGKQTANNLEVINALSN
tara:strand:+ start:114445 stop:114675 length:231 start_codon:yes stop_codon:yes gene_type:complete